MSYPNRTAPHTRSLTSASLAAALEANKQASLEEIARIPTAQADNKSYKLLLTCQYTGLNCGSLTLPTVAGYLPLLGQWKQQQVLHPLFSLELIPLLKFSRNTWLRFCGFSQEEAEDQVLTSKQEQTLQVACLAMLHSLTEVQQDVPWIPSFLEVQNNWQSLISLCYWKAYLNSNRFKFPAVRISKRENSINLKAFLQTCWEQKKSYETSVNGMIEEEKADIAEKSLVAIRDELSGKRPVSVKLLWRWFISNLSVKYSKDAAPDGWMYELFTAKGNSVFEYTMADIDLFEEIFLSECPLGSSISHAFSEILSSKRQLLTNHFEAFEILVPMELQQQADSGQIAQEEPKLADFPKKVQWIVAHAKWKLTHGSSASASSNRQAAAVRQQTISVAASYIPKLPSALEQHNSELEVTDLEDVNEIDYIAPGSIADLNNLGQDE